MLRRGRKEKTSDRIVNSSLVVYDKPWYSASCNLGPPRGKSFQGSVGPHNRNTSGSSSNDTVRTSTGNGTPATRRSGRPVSQQGDRQKRAVSGSGRFSKTQEPGPSEDRELTPRSAGEKALRSILKREKNTMRPKSSHDLSLRKQQLPDDENRSCSSPTSRPTCLSPSRQQSGRMSGPAAPSPPPPPFRQSRIPRCTYLNSNGDVPQERTKLPARSQSSNEWCRGRPKFSRQSQSPTRRETAALAKKTSDAKERPPKREWVGIGSGKCDYGLAAGSSRSVPGYDPVGSSTAGNRRSESSDPNYDRKVSRRHSENDVRRNNRRSPRMDDERCEFQSARSSWSSHIDIVTVNPSPQQLSQSSIGHNMTTPRSMSSDNNSGSSRPYYRRVFDWLSTFADTQWSNLKLIKHYVVPVTMKAKRTASYPERLQCSKSNHLTTYSSGSQTSPSANNSSSCNAPANLAGQTPGFASTACCRGRTSPSEQQEQYPSLRGAQMSAEEKWSAIKKHQQQQQHKNPGDPKQSNSRPELKSSTLEGQSSSHSHSRTSVSAAGGRPSILTTCSSAMELAGSRLDRMQESAADAITQMRGPEFVMPRKLLKSETLLTKSLTKEFEDTANMPSTCRRTAQFRKLLSELPAENYYVVEWLVTNNIVNESNASRFGHLFKVKPNVLEVLTRHRDLLFPTAL